MFGAADVGQVRCRGALTRDVDAATGYIENRSSEMTKHTIVPSCDASLFALAQGPTVVTLVGITPGCGTAAPQPSAVPLCSLVEALQMPTLSTSTSCSFFPSRGKNRAPCRAIDFRNRSRQAPWRHGATHRFARVPCHAFFAGSAQGCFCALEGSDTRQSHGEAGSRALLSLHVGPRTATIGR